MLTLKNKDIRKRWIFFKKYILQNTLLNMLYTTDLGQGHNLKFLLSYLSAQSILPAK